MKTFFGITVLVLLMVRAVPLPAQTNVFPLSATDKSAKPIVPAVAPSRAGH